MTFSPRTTSAAAGQRPAFPWLLLALSAVCAVIGWPLLSSPFTSPSSTPTAPAPRATSSAVAAAPSTDEVATRHTPAAPRSSPSAPGPRSSPTPSPAGELPPRGEGRAGDRAIQQLLERSWPADLPAAQTAQLLTTASRVLRADVTGRGQAAFPTAFPAAVHGDAVAPAFTRFRIQAAIARHDPIRPHRAVVHLVWAAADRGGTYTDGRLADIPFTRPTKESTAWTPLPPTAS
ncbi:hypothetical protein V2W30_41145 (plasmid) [Streptomyces sp. Q6]|uniref:Uncharacterized protein n=1 Tax=Streptomyces citrinus TaxID=3118173 RepID=A0ACD5AR29_9ACTN